MNLNRDQQHYLANETPRFMQHDKEPYRFPKKSYL